LPAMASLSSAIVARFSKSAWRNCATFSGLGAIPLVASACDFPVAIVLSPSMTNSAAPRAALLLDWLLAAGGYEAGVEPDVLAKKTAHERTKKHDHVSSPEAAAYDLITGNAFSQEYLLAKKIVLAIARATRCLVPRKKNGTR
jgi:hypothetical protein